MLDLALCHIKRPKLASTRAPAVEVRLVVDSGLHTESRTIEDHIYDALFSSRYVARPWHSSRGLANPPRHLKIYPRALDSIARVAPILTGLAVNLRLMFSGT
jgi:hypothetical protein